MAKQTKRPLSRTRSPGGPRSRVQTGNKKHRAEATRGAKTSSDEAVGHKIIATDAVGREATVHEAADQEAIGHEAIGIFAKAPLPGRTKTRLIPLLGAGGAAAFHRAALLDTIELVRATGVPFTVFITPGSHRRIFEQLGIPSSHLVAQGGGSLGSRMARALNHLLQKRNTKRAVLIGTDSPDLPRSRIEGALQELHKSDAALAPALDGGYTVIGCRQRLAIRHDLQKLLAKVSWSTSTTFRETVAAFCSVGATPALLAPWPDVDEPTDFAAMVERYRVLELIQTPLPRHTATWLRERGEL